MLGGMKTALPLVLATTSAPAPEPAIKKLQAEWLGHLGAGGSRTCPRR